jgi:hypothetical protein
VHILMDSLIRAIVIPLYTEDTKECCKYIILHRASALVIVVLHHRVKHKADKKNACGHDAREERDQFPL